MLLISALPVPSVHNFTVALAFLRLAVHSNRICQLRCIRTAVIHIYVPLSPSGIISYIIDFVYMLILQ